MNIKYHVRLTDDERVMLEAMIKQEKPKVAQHKKRRAGILLAIDESQSPLTHEQVAKAFRVRPLTICRLRQRFVEVFSVLSVFAQREHLHAKCWCHKLPLKSRSA